MEPAAAAAFRNDPARFAKSRGLSGPNFEAITRLSQEGTDYFARRRLIDRAAYLGSDLPRSVAALEQSVGLESTYFADRPYAFEEPIAEIKQFQAWAKVATKSKRISQAVGDLCAIECAGALLMMQAFEKPRPSKSLRRNPQMKVLRLATDPDALLSAGIDGAAAGRFVVAVVRDEDDVEVYAVDAVGAALVRAANGRRTPANVTERLSRRFDRRGLSASLGLLRRRLVLCP